MIKNFNTDCCYARLKTNIFKQCNNKKHNNDFCCKHFNYNGIKINQELFDNDYINNLLDNHDYLLSKKFYNLKDNFILIKYILLKIINNKIYNINDIINTNKKNLIPIYISTVNNYVYYKNNIKNIINIQSIVKKNIINNIIKLKGPGLYNKNLCINEIDFYTCENINKINFDYFISYEDIDNKIYAFDIRSLNILIKNNQNNPYNRNSIPQYLKDNNIYIIKYLQNNNINIDFPEDELTQEQIFNDKVIKIFKKIDNFNYNTNINWFTKLNIPQLKQYWILLEDTWNWRANLTNQDKYKIIQNKHLFKEFKKINNINLIKTLQNYILDDIDILISNGITKNDSATGVLYVLSTLSNISIDCGLAMPWLIFN